MSASIKNRAKIGLERLEARDQMSVVVGGLGDKSGILTFSEAPKTPDAHDRIEIVDTGLGGPGQLHYRINGGAWVHSPVEVWRVALDLKGGNDTVIYNLGRSFDPAGVNGLGATTNTLDGRYREIRGGVRSGATLAPTDGTGLGAGNDTLTATVWGDVGTNTSGTNTGFGVFLDADNGNDTVTTRLRGDVRGQAGVGVSVHGGQWDAGRDIITLDMTNDVDIGTFAGVWANLSGGAGADDIFVNYRGELDGKLSFNAAGEAGDDWVVSNNTLDAGSTGYFGGGGGGYGRAIVDGGADNDSRLEFCVTNNSGGTARINADLYGGAGEDTFIFCPLWVNTPDMTASESGRATRR